MKSVFQSLTLLTLITITISSCMDNKSNNIEKKEVMEVQQPKYTWEKYA